MKSSKITTSKRKYTRRRKSQKLSFTFFLRFPVPHLILTCLALFLYFKEYPTESLDHVIKTKTYAEQVTKVASPSATPTTTLTPTPLPTLSVIQPPTSTSYCLTVPIILYHHVEPLADATREGHAQLTVDSTIFDKQMSYLQSTGYHSLSLDELVNALLHKTPLPAKSIAITLDDGYIDDYTYAFQILKKYNLKGNFMIPTGLIMNPDYMTWDNVREIDKSGIGFIYNHTWSHAPLGQVSPDKIESELNLSQMQFQQQLGRMPVIFTYPYGSFSDTAIRILKEHGFIAGFTTIAGRLQCDTNIMTLYREHIGNAPMAAYGL